MSYLILLIITIKRCEYLFQKIRNCDAAGSIGFASSKAFKFNEMQRNSNSPHATDWWSFGVVVFLFQFEQSNVWTEVTKTMTINWHSWRWITSFGNIPLRLNIPHRVCIAIPCGHRRILATAMAPRWRRWCVERFAWNVRLDESAYFHC